MYWMTSADADLEPVDRRVVGRVHEREAADPEERELRNVGAADAHEVAAA